MSARDELLAEYGLADTAPLGTLAELRQKLDAFRAEVLREAANTLRIARRAGNLFLISEEEFLEHLALTIAEAAEAGKVTRAAGEITRAAHADGEPHTNSEAVFRQIAVTPWPRCATLIIDGQPPLIGSYGGAGMGRAPSGDALIVEPQLWFDDAPATEGGATHAGESTQPAELTVYRASHDSIVMGFYTTAAAARAHCEADMRRDLPSVSLDWIEDEEDGVVELVAAVGEEERPTGFVVTALGVASEYDEEADE